MARTFYKAQGIGKTPICAICGGPGRGTRAKHHLTRGVYVWLCEDHRSDEFQTRRRGRDFVTSLLTVWRAAGSMTKRQSKALEDHLDRVRQSRPQGDRRGSYAWPKLREEAERRFAAGEDPNIVIPDLRRRYERLPINAPTERTLRRWFTDGRWLVRPPAPTEPDPETDVEPAPADDPAAHPPPDRDVLFAAETGVPPPPPGGIENPEVPPP